jgi:activator of HSP90 ATPase
MAKTIVQKLLFKNTSPSKIYDLYMNAKLHTLITGASAKISNKTGASFTAHGPYISGKNLYLVKDKLIVQTWRAENWTSKDPDSIFMIALEQKGNDVVLYATHANVPDREEASLKDGWHQYYWKPMKQYLAGKEITRVAM